jgi:hypothetical protein
MSTAETQAPQEDVLPNIAALESRVLLLAPSISFWRGSYQLPKGNTAVEIDGATVDKETITTPRAILLNKQYPRDSTGVPWKTRLQTLASRQKAVIESYSVPFPIHGVRIVPKRSGGQFFRDLFGDTIGGLERRYRQAVAEENRLIANDLMERINRAKAADNLWTQTTPVFDPDRPGQSVAYQLYTMTREFVTQLPDILGQIERNLDPKVWAGIVHKIPRDPTVMRRKFGMDCTPIELAGTSNSNSITADDLDEHSNLVRQALQDRIDEAVTEIIARPRQDLIDALTNLGELVNRDGNVTAKSFRPVITAIQKLRMFNLTDDGRTEELLSALERRLNITTANSLTAVTAAQNGFMTALLATIEEVGNAQHQAEIAAEFGSRELRSIDLD